MPVTLRDIADRLNVSTAVVSRVLNDKPGIWASEETRQRVLDMARELNYRPSTAARALATGRSMMLAVSSADVDWHLGRSGRLAEMRGLIEAAAAQHYRVLVLPSTAAQVNVGQFEALIRSNGCDGFCLYAEQAHQELYDFLQKQRTPFVVIGHPGEIQVPRVDHDNYGLMKNSVRWLAAQGRRRIAYVRQQEIVPAFMQPEAPYMRVQEEGYRAGILETCGTYDAGLLVSRDWDDENILAWLKESEVDAVILTGLASVLQWKLCLARAGVRLPEEVLLMGHVDTPELNYLERGKLHEGLACHVFDPQAVGHRAGQMLTSWINGHQVASEPVLIASYAPRWC